MGCICSVLTEEKCRHTVESFTAPIPVSQTRSLMDDRSKDVSPRCDWNRIMVLLTV